MYFVRRIKSQGKAELEFYDRDKDIELGERSAANDTCEKFCSYKKHSITLRSQHYV